MSRLCMIIWVSVVLKGTVVTVTDVSSTSVEVIIIVKVNCVSSALSLVNDLSLTVLVRV